MAKLLDNSSTVPDTGDWNDLSPGVWKIVLETSDTNATVTIEQRVDGGSAIVMAQHTANGYRFGGIYEDCLLPVAENEQVRAVRTGGSGAVTVHANLMKHI